jgi:hypothetical protein
MKSSAKILLILPVFLLAIPVMGLMCPPIWWAYTAKPNNNCQIWPDDGTE